jgi:hypothetical protein
MAMAMAMFTGIAHADDLENWEDLAQERFRGLSQDLAGIVGFRSLASARPGGMASFELALDVSSTQLGDAEAWETVTGARSSNVAAGRVRFSKGLPYNVDIAGFYTSVPGSNVSAYGAEVRYALVEGGLAMPAVQVRGGFSQLSGVTDFRYGTRNLDLAVSKGFGPVTPYAGAGRIWVDSEYRGDEADLEKESFGRNRMFAGLRLSAVVMNVVLEYERMRETETYSAKLAFGF